MPRIYPGVPLHIRNPHPLIVPPDPRSAPADIPTVKIVNPEVVGLGYQIINESDFDATKHVLYVEPADASKVVPLKARKG